MSVSKVFLILVKIEKKKIAKTQYPQEKFHIKYRERKQNITVTENDKHSRGRVLIVLYSRSFFIAQYPS